MVNTFVTTLLDSSRSGRAAFEKSAQDLDNKRIGKQRVEAMQILHILVGIRICASFYQRVYDPTRETVQSYITSLIRLFKQNPVLIVVDNDCQNYTIYETVGSIDKIPNHWIFREGYSSHPAVRMWFGYEEALKEYTNTMIDNFIARGGKNTMHRYTLPTQIDYPPWLSDPLTIGTHRAALLKKDFSFYCLIFGSLEMIICEYHLSQLASPVLYQKIIDPNEKTSYWWPVA